MSDDARLLRLERQVTVLRWFTAGLSLVVLVAAGSAVTLGRKLVPPSAPSAPSVPDTLKILELQVHRVAVVNEDDQVVGRLTGEKVGGFLSLFDPSTKGAGVHIDSCSPRIYSDAAGEMKVGECQGGRVSLSDTSGRNTLEMEAADHGHAAIPRDGGAAIALTNSHGVANVDIRVEPSGDGHVAVSDSNGMGRIFRP